MNAWQQFTLTHVALQDWRSGSYLHRSIVGILRSWRQSSLLIQWADQIAAVLLSLIFVLAPFVSSILVGLLLVACGGFWLLVTLTDIRDQAKLTSVHLLVLLYWGIATVATAASPVKSAAFVGWTKLTLYLLMFALAARVLRSPRIRAWMIAIYLHVALLVSVYGLRQWFFGATALATWVDPESPLSKTTRVYSYLGNPNLLAGYLLPAIAFSAMAIFAWRGWIPKALALTMLLVNMACLILTFSRGGWIGLLALVVTLLVLLVYWLSIQLPPFWRMWSLPILLVGMLSVLILAILFVEPVRDRVLSIFAGRGDSSNNFRINVWLAVIDMIRDRPILGIGPGNTAFNRIYPLYQQPKYTALSAYSVLLEIAVETGLIGLFCFVWLVIVMLSQGLTQLQRLRQHNHREGFWLMAAIAIVVGMLAHGTVDTVWYRPEVSTLWWLTVALIAGYLNASVSEPNPGNSTVATQ
ncbi:putative bicarbonate transporter, IctB family [Gloeocapsopsis crepidinum LEGE 06123]|uniref:Bicarbonate transporter, IctB family n=1 Tax=Gloeocapsopsis crepidinum LEGE 06123 TaxID=588587 RepID=A0ABR9UTJ6_9CHRO|nr:IctB family putative bicarbonate transporter [Gloeocapsopsis crepidinum]MBE9191625.1 putative bicarbonate transporter, IctB family [Gloeocapsopsis crepidinum LEGE 06123]